MNPESRGRARAAIVSPDVGAHGEVAAPKTCRLPAVSTKTRSDPARHAYTDLATRPLEDNELKALDLFHETRGGAEAVEKQHRQDVLIESVRAAHEAA